MTEPTKALMPFFLSIEQVRNNPEMQKQVTAGEIVCAFMSQRALEAITAPTPPSIIEKKGKFDFVGHVHYRAKLAQAYGYDYDWEPDVRIDWDHGYVFCFGRLTVRYRNPITGEIYGTRVANGEDAKPLTKLSSGAGYVDIGNDMKSVDSEALKIAVKNLGFFSDLYVRDGHDTLEEAEAKVQAKAEAQTETDATARAAEATRLAASLRTQPVTCYDCHGGIVTGTSPKGEPISLELLNYLAMQNYHVPLCIRCFAVRHEATKTANTTSATVQAAVETATQAAASKGT